MSWHSTGMCNAYEQHVRWVEYTQMIQDLKLGIPTQQTRFAASGHGAHQRHGASLVGRRLGVELAQMNFSFAPCRPQGRPLFNFRSEGWDFSKSGRCLIPASGFFEYVGTKCLKTQYQFTLTEALFRAIIGLWREAECNHPVSFAMLTTSSGSRHRALSRPAGRRAGARELGRLALSAPATGGVARCRYGPRGQE